MAERAGSWQQGSILRQCADASPLIIAHRGFRACYPENTLLALHRSLGRCHMVELDVRLSRDGEVVVFHDELLIRTTDAATRAQAWGIPSLHLRHWSLCQLRRLDAGSWFIKSDPFGSLTTGLIHPKELTPLMPQPIPTLDEVLAWCGKQRIPLNIELKDLGDESENHRLAEAVINGILRRQLTDLILLSSFHHSLLRLCRRLEPSIARAALAEKRHPPQLCDYLRDLDVCAYHPHDAITDRALVSELRSAGIAVNVFTVNDQERRHQLAQFGVSGIITDYPDYSRGCQD
jgi:glycerophosphoryl diester phosphodiesterase